MDRDLTLWPFFLPVAVIQKYRITEFSLYGVQISCGEREGGGIRSLQLQYRFPIFSKFATLTSQKYGKTFSNPPQKSLKRFLPLLRLFASLTRCGEGGIRTPGRLSPTLPFQGSTLDRSATSPLQLLYHILNIFAYSPLSTPQDCLPG